MVKQVPKVTPRLAGPAKGVDSLDEWVQQAPETPPVSPAPSREDVRAPAPSRQEVEAPEVVPPVRRDTVRVVRKRDQAELRRITTYLPKGLHTRLMLRCAARDEGLADALAEAVTLLLEREGR